MSQWLWRRPIAHRGLHGARDIPENSLAAFVKCVFTDTPIELDVRLTKDRQVVVFHDATLGRLCGVDARVRALPYEAMQPFRLLGTDQRIPLLAEVLETVSGKVPLLIELKSDGRGGVLEERVAAVLKDYPGEYAVQSFSPWTVGWFRLHRPAVRRGQLVDDYEDRKDMDFFTKWFFTNRLHALLTKPMFLSVNKRLLRGTVLKRLSQSRLPVLVWTITSNEERDFCLAHGFNYIFDPFDRADEAG